MPTDDDIDPRFRPTHRSFGDGNVTRDDARRSVEGIADLQRRMYAPGERFRVCDDGELERRAKYARRHVAETQARLQDAGFEHVGDVQDVIANRTGWWLARPAYIRVMLHPDGTQAGVYSVRMAWAGSLLALFRLVPRTMRTIDLETELTDGRFVVTSNLLGINTADPKPGIAQRLLDPATPVSEILAEHRLSVRESGGEAVPIRTLDQAIASQTRLNDLKRADLATRGFAPTPDEIRRANSGKMDRATALTMEEADRRGRRGKG